VTSKEDKRTRGAEMKSMKSVGLLLVVALFLLAGMLLAGCGGDDEATTTTAAAGSETTAGGTDTTGAAPSGDPVVIGAIVSATGPGAALGEQERNVLEMMQEQLNAAGGVLGRPVEIMIEDDKSDPKEAVTAANRLIDQEKAVALIASTISASTLAVKEITAAKGLPQMAMAAANDITDKAPMEWIWRTPHKDALAVARALTYISESLQLTKIAVLHDENAFGSSGNAEIEKTAADYGLEIVATESYKTQDTDLTAQLTKIKGADPEVIIVWGTNPGPALAAKNMQQLGMDIPYVGSHGIANKTFIELAGDAAEGVVFPAGKLLVPSSITDPEQKEVTEAFAAAYQAKYGSAPNTFAGYAFEAVSLLVNAIETAGSTEPAAIQGALDATQNFAGPDGFYNYSKTDHDGLKAEDMIMVKIQGGAWVLAE
jgi:branched-chain amino acid transport system substrate-binding protein